ncbi:TPA: class I SAM-dependent methyltransferase [Campylobacter lari]|uniref:class I SAM-dependent methyltransferase n=1 Tax=Campylobacter sp. W0066.2 TaxID=2735752 RepID=UPI002986B216|nr:class I SAM-dependent methyltransferase [Campylobacter sp. W0066.2]HEG2580767.1 class I SAM-dependent methyltransferase [Campylobacter lari]
MKDTILFQNILKTRPSKKYQIITCFEVMEYTTNTLKLHKEIFSLLEENGIIIFSTLLQPNNIEELKTNWWYIAPRNGHFSFYA